ncbi:MAG: hypothetical protein BWY83_02885 [bacterium ADurb.Bin478]|nr:MAG: hypothetical protein BWY83_02885 [bacterium ADurb.Bin478]
MVDKFDRALHVLQGQGVRPNEELDSMPGLGAVQQPIDLHCVHLSAPGRLLSRDGHPVRSERHGDGFFVCAAVKAPGLTAGPDADVLKILIAVQDYAVFVCAQVIGCVQSNRGPPISVVRGQATGVPSRHQQQQRHQHSSGTAAELLQHFFQARQFQHHPGEGEDKRQQESQRNQGEAQRIQHRFEKTVDPTAVCC